MIVNLIC